MRWSWLVLIAGCKFTPGVSPASDGAGSGGSDGPIVMDAPVQMDAYDPLCYGKAPFTVCLQAAPTGDIFLADIDTTPSSTTCDGGSGTVMMVGGSQACVKAAAKWTVSSGTLGVTGPLPLVLLASDMITVDGYLDASSAPAGAGPGANPVPGDCPTAGIDGSNNGGGGGGGAGGSFGAAGGGGGKGNNNSTTAGSAAMPPMMPVAKLRAGCRGGKGGDGASSTGGAGGYGGGAVYLVTHGTIAITANGTIDASGEGGKKGLHSKGAGGGGGSGGMIVLYALGAITTSSGAKIFANGGAGGGGADNNSDGQDGQSATSATMPAIGGPAGGGAASAGGNGAFGTTPAGSAQGAGGGGGGGGGGAVGVIRVLSGQPLGNAIVSPTAGP